MHTTPGARYLGGRCGGLTVGTPAVETTSLSLGKCLPPTCAGQCLRQWHLPEHVGHGRPLPQVTSAFATVSLTSAVTFTAEPHPSPASPASSTLRQWHRACSLTLESPDLRYLPRRARRSGRLPRSGGADNWAPLSCGPEMWDMRCGEFLGWRRVASHEQLDMNGGGERGAQTWRQVSPRHDLHVVLRGWKTHRQGLAPIEQTGTGPVSSQSSNLSAMSRRSWCRVAPGLEQGRTQGQNASASRPSTALGSVNTQNRLRVVLVHLLPSVQRVNVRR